MKKTEILTLEEIEKMEKNFLSAKEAISALGMSKNTFYRLARTGGAEFPVIRMGKKIGVPRKPFIEYLRGKEREI